jgi:hypothetical protein
MVVGKKGKFPKGIQTKVAQRKLIKQEEITKLKEFLSFLLPTTLINGHISANHC